MALTNSMEKLSTGAPSVDLLNSTVPAGTNITPSIGVRKIQPKKGGVSLLNK